jgi:pSer/pThr/pTyr-binding forkhead associated (FHA) protein
MSIAVDSAEHYRQLLQLGRAGFIAAAAPAALVRHHEGDLRPDSSAAATMTMDDEFPTIGPNDPNPLAGMNKDAQLEVYPLTKKPGASFPDRITIGRTSNNDVVINDASVSRLHAYVRREGDKWLVADAGSKNGTRLAGERLEARKERAIKSRVMIRFGDLELTFFLAEDLFDALGGT